MAPSQYIVGILLAIILFNPEVVAQQSITTNTSDKINLSSEDSRGFKEQTRLIMKTSYKKKGSTYSKYQIKNIDQEGYSYNEKAETHEIFKKGIKSVSKVGLAITVFGGVGQNTLNDEMLNNITVDDHQYSYDLEQNSTFHAGAGIQYFINQSVGVKTGLHYSQYSTSYSLKGLFQNDQIKVFEPNNWQYYNVIDANIDSTVNISTVTLPVSLVFHYGKPGKFGFFAEGGFNIALNVQRKYNTTGDIKSGIHLPVFDSLGIKYLWADEIAELEGSSELNLFDRTDLDETGDAPIKPISLELHFSAGVVIPIGYYNSVVVGPEIKYGITDLNDRSNYKDLFGEDVKTGKMNMYSFSLKISYIYKL